MNHHKICIEELSVLEDVKILADHNSKLPWKVIIADDEPEIHSVTRLVLGDFEFAGRKLKFLSAYTGAETCKLIEENPDTALLLLDVVMESESAGLRVVRYIRNELKNPFIRIILRTGQPGQAPEREIISTYDINDYKEKTDLTSERLYTTVMASLRTYKDLQMIERNRRSLERIVKVSPEILQYNSLKQLANELLLQLSALLTLENSNFTTEQDSIFVIWDRDEPFCLAAQGRFRSARMKVLSDVVPAEVNDVILRVVDEGIDHFDQNSYCCAFTSANGVRHAIYLRSSYLFKQQDLELLQLFSATAASWVENIHLNKEIEATQTEIIDTLGEMIECRFREMGKHVRRVSAYACLLAVKAGLSKRDAEILKFASPIHDVGKIGIPDEILKKPGSLSKKEFEIMKTHTLIGYNILKNSDRPILKQAAIIALQHHERWDGKGYPKGLAGKNIDIAGRIIRIVDVFDALSHKRVYKTAWDLDKIKDYLSRESGSQFDPQLIKLFLDNIDEFLAIRDQYPDDVKQL